MLYKTIMATASGNSAYREYILRDGFQTLDSVSLITQIKALREALEQMRSSSQTAAPVLEKKLRYIADNNRL